jgi:hypothetical protein
VSFNFFPLFSFQSASQLVIADQFKLELSLEARTVLKHGMSGSQAKVLRNTRKQQHRLFVPT